MQIFGTFTLFLALYMVFGPGRISFGPGGAKNVEDLHVCFPGLAVIVFVDLDEFVLDLEELFWTERVFVFNTGFCFLDPRTCFVDRASTGVGGELHCYMRSHWAGCFLDLGPLFWTCTCFMDLAQGGGKFRNCDKVHARSC